MRNEKVAAAMSFIGTSAALLLVFRRCVPGLRLVINATLGPGVITTFAIGFVFMVARKRRRTDETPTRH
jgi:hypothetical protein